MARAGALRRAVCLGALALAGMAAAQPRAPALAGVSLDGLAVDLQSLRGKVVLVFVWSTRCPVCMDQMPELRRNLAGWQGRDFVVLALSQDASADDVRAYARAMAAVGTPQGAQFRLLWRRAPGHRDDLGELPERLPATFLVDREGRLVKQSRGRWDPELWNEVAEVLLN